MIVIDHERRAPGSQRNGVQTIDPQARFRQKTVRIIVLIDQRCDWRLSPPYNPQKPPRHPSRMRVGVSRVSFWKQALALLESPTVRTNASHPPYFLNVVVVGIKTQNHGKHIESFAQATTVDQGSGPGC